MSREQLLMKIAEKFGALKCFEETNKLHFDYSLQSGSNRLAIIWNPVDRPNEVHETNIFVTDENDLDLLHQVISNILDGYKTVQILDLEEL